MSFSKPPFFVSFPWRTEAHFRLLGFHWNAKRTVKSNNVYYYAYESCYVSFLHHIHVDAGLLNLKIAEVGASQAKMGRLRRNRTFSLFLVFGAVNS